MQASQLDEWLCFAEEVARQAGEILQSKQAEGFEVSKKGRVDLVTEADLASEKFLVERIRERYPDHQILAEEQGATEGESEVKWVIDPLDGTTNFAHGYPLYAVSIGIEVEGEVRVGVVFDPVAGECFSARKGNGAYLNGRRIQTSRRKSLVDSLLCTGFSYQEGEIEANLALFHRMMKTVRSVRRDGSAALDLCYVACGRFDGFWELSLHPWDVAAGNLLVEEAGGKVSRFDGSEVTIYDRECLATNGAIHQELGSILTGSG